MGNAPSTSAAPRPPPSRPAAPSSSSSPPPAPAPRSRALKSRKRSIVAHPVLLIPDPAQPAPPVASLPVPAPVADRLPASSPIPIPTLAGQPPPLRPTPPTNDDSFADLLHLPELSTHRPIQYNSTRSFGAVRRGGIQGTVWGQPEAPPLPRPAPKLFLPELVHSSIPIRLPRPTTSPRRRRPPPVSALPAPGPPTTSVANTSVANTSAATTTTATASGAPAPPTQPSRPLPTTIVWRGGGRQVYVAGTFDTLEWRTRQRMRYDSNSGAHSHTLLLAPGTFRLKFIVDDVWRCSEDLPTATDDDTGNLVNYIHVEDPNADPVTTDEEHHARDARVLKANRRRNHQFARSGKPLHPPQLPPSDSAFWSDLDTDTELEAIGWTRGRDNTLEKWSNNIPAPLIAAAHLEEAYVGAVQAQRDVRRGGAGFRGTLASLGPGVPSIPPAPRLPRHLDKVILNTRTPSESSSKHRSSSSKRSRLGMTALLAPPAAPSSSTTRATTNIMDQPAAADDSSVLPVPNHVVLHHLGTSAIKNGVLAVSDTTRYNKKYITTIYYKPT